MTIDARVMAEDATMPRTDYGKNVEVKVEPSASGLPVALTLHWHNESRGNVPDAPQAHTALLSRRQALVLAHTLFELASDR